MTFLLTQRLLRGSEIHAHARSISNQCAEGSFSEGERAHQKPDVNVATPSNWLSPKSVQNDTRWRKVIQSDDGYWVQDTSRMGID